MYGNVFSSFSTYTEPKYLLIFSFGVSMTLNIVYRDEVLNVIHNIIFIKYIYVYYFVSFSLGFFLSHFATSVGAQKQYMELVKYVSMLRLAKVLYFIH